MGYKFRVIQTAHPKETTVRAEHEQKLNNHLNYDFAGTDEDMRSLQNGPALISYDRCVISASTSTTVKNHDFIMTTTLCCEDKERIG